MVSAAGILRVKAARAPSTTEGGRWVSSAARASRDRRLPGTGGRTAATGHIRPARQPGAAVASSSATATPPATAATQPA
jgi:hypothetical protein